MILLGPLEKIYEDPWHFADRRRNFNVGVWQHYIFKKGKGRRRRSC